MSVPGRGTLLSAVWGKGLDTELAAKAVAVNWGVSARGFGADMGW